MMWRSVPRCRAMTTGCLVAFAVLTGPAAAQSGPPPGGGPWSVTSDVQGFYQPDAGIDGGGDMSVARGFVRLGVSRGFGPRTSVGVAIGGGRSDYDFSGDILAPWDDTESLQVSLPVRFGVGDRASVFVVPSLRYNAETSADLGDGRAAAVIGAVAWRFSDRLTLGPGFGWVEGLDGDDDVFPILVIDWRIADRLRLTTGRGVGATQGPGLSLIWAARDDLDLGIALRREDVEFRLDDEGSAPGGTGEVASFPIVATIGWSPSPTLRVNAFAGVNYDGQITQRDAAGSRVLRRDVDTVPVMGGQVSFRF